MVITGESTGKKTPKEKIIRVKRVAEEVPVGVGSGATVKNIREIASYIDFVIVGTGIKYERITENPVDEEEVKRFVKVWKRYTD